MFCHPKRKPNTTTPPEHKMLQPKSILLLVFALLAATAAALPPSAARPSRRVGPGGMLPLLPILPDSPAAPARPSHRGGPAGILPILPILPDQPAPATARPKPNRPSWGIIPLPRILPDRPPSPAAAAPPVPVPSPSPAAAPVVELEPSQCMPSLAGLVSCVDYLNDYRIVKPMAACCGDFRKLVDEAPICFCHAMKGGDINEMMPEPINIARLMSSIPKACGVPLPVTTLAKCKTEPVPPLTTVPFASAHP